ncbi:hypothetical protein MBSD_n0855 [Mizugakiibacter sediminis]|uniref:DUF2845 domain-containing protein n=1 Tax=Mizugakiibacter sediminis TaxID=1475481 RepID=A0A0K8QKU6_9GAMM|nr:DUF2845 domain-containing protein [Mizugakiibacter sediminis]GAP65565.1 hypothetical protein MBSD_n0855 [Mizugakiibacter sediminis]
MRAAVLLACLLLPILAEAADTVRIGTRIVEVGDSAALLRDVAGEPQSRRAARADAERGRRRDGGERWTYRERGRTLDFVVRDGVIVAIERDRR